MSSSSDDLLLYLQFLIKLQGTFKINILKTIQTNGKQGLGRSWGIYRYLIAM